MLLTRPFAPTIGSRWMMSFIADGDGHSAGVGFGDLSEADFRPAQDRREWRWAGSMRGRLADIAKHHQMHRRAAVREIEPADIDAGLRSWRRKVHIAQAGPMVATILVRITEFLPWIDPFN